MGSRAVATWLPAASLGILSLVAADRAGAVTGVGAQPFIIITATDPAQPQARALASALRAQGAWLVVDPGLAGPCAPPA